ncbi:MAG TPA: SMC-Scp complex subunit ScpB [Elusimicrobia bacterium]|nr:SMC-Scp complex subunit ScpB [Elusimicrobiota bacterium]HBT60472.1 SMC-Scp complex subunit ScpB [Elusimicrobiota bacterium]
MSQTPASPLEDEELRKQLETILFITDHPLSLEELRKLTGVKDMPRLGALVDQIRQGFEDRASALQLVEIAGGFQMATRPSYGPLVRKLFAEKMTMRLSTAAHETLAIVAYKQPLTRAEVEEIRGVEVIASLETLLEKRLIKVVGRKETVGRPLLYGTTADFMRHFGLRSLEDLPPIDNFKAEEPGAAPAPAGTPDPGAPAPEPNADAPALEIEAPAPSDSVQPGSEAAAEAEIPPAESPENALGS